MEGMKTNRIKELCTRRGIDQKRVALKIGVSQPTVSDWFNQKKNPRGERLEKLCSMLDVTEAVLLGYNADPLAPQSEPSQDSSFVAIRLRELREQSGKTQDAVADACGISRLTLSRYESGDTVPKASALAALAQYYDVPLSHLTACVDVQSKKSAAVSDSADSRARAIYEIELEFGKLSEEKLWESLRYMKYLETTD